MAKELECSFSAAPSAGRKTASGDSVWKQITVLSILVTEAVKQRLEPVPSNPRVPGLNPAQVPLQYKQAIYLYIHRRLSR